MYAEINGTVDISEETVENLNQTEVLYLVFDNYFYLVFIRLLHEK